MVYILASVTGNEKVHVVCEVSFLEAIQTLSELRQQTGAFTGLFSSCVSWESVREERQSSY